MSTAKRRRSCSPPANRQRIRSSPPAASSPYFPPELIPEVASRLTSLQDFFALRAACRAYRALLPLTSSHLASQAPLILVDSGSTPLSYALFHPTIRRIHRFRLSRSPLADNGYCVSTKLHPIGCRLAVCETEYMLPGGPPTHTSFSIVHLLTGERTCISSPPDRVCRVLLSGDLVLTFNWNSPQAIQYCHLEAADWRLAAITQPYSILDLLYVNGVLYALVVGDLGCRLAAVELSENEGSVELVILGGCWDDNSPCTLQRTLQGAAVHYLSSEWCLLPSTSLWQCFGVEQPSQWHVMTFDQNAST
ncbi:hypothetical protein U9M48_037903 [Paspalum notatum var. saurae]|uniref:F-box domain-containing protein n=1 Tax=Paspalum notatum var. saurae TaxID=547442 RepID=A0AAQ3UKC2_PASNO